MNSWRRLRHSLGYTNCCTALSLCSCYAVGKTYGASFGIAGFFFLFSLGYVNIFKMMYTLYTTRIGFYIKDSLHPKVPNDHCITETLHVDTRLSGQTNKQGQSLCQRFSVRPVPVSVDNLAYFIIVDEDESASDGGEVRRTAAVIDPADAEKIYDVAGRLGLKLTHILTSHKHWDHAGGNQDLVNLVRQHENGRQLTVIGSEEDKPDACNAWVNPGDTIFLGSKNQCKVDILYASGHTTGSVMFLVNDTALFTGDCLFCGGCGAMFEASPEAVLKTYDTLHAVHTDVKVFCGHEYSGMLMGELKQRLPNNPEVRQRWEEVMALVKKKKCTMPTTMAIEKRINPLLTVRREHLQELVNRDASSAALEALLYGDPSNSNGGQGGSP